MIVSPLDSTPHWEKKSTEDLQVKKKIKSIQVSLATAVIKFYTTYRGIEGSLKIQLKIYLKSSLAFYSYLVLRGELL